MWTFAVILGLPVYLILTSIDHPTPQECAVARTATLADFPDAIVTPCMLDDIHLPAGPGRPGLTPTKRPRGHHEERPPC